MPKEAKKPDYHPQTQFRLEPPLGRLKSFRLRYKSIDTKDNWVSLVLPEITSANDLLKSGTVSQDHTETKLRQILKEQYAHRDRKKRVKEFLPGNLAIMEKYWEENYPRRKLRSMVNPADSRKNLENAAEACGTFPMDTCDLEELEDHIHERFKNEEAKLERRIIWVNAMLKWLGRKPMDYIKRPKPRVKYINESDFLSMLSHIPEDQDQRLARIAFYTGMRLGEIFGMESQHVRDSSIWVERQMTKRKDSKKEHFLPGPPKNGSPRESFYPARVHEDIAEWCKLSWNAREEFRMRDYAEVIRDACFSKFGEHRLTCFRDLRHCAVIWLLQSGASMAEVAQQIGDGVEVCYRHYAGFELKRESIERFKRLVD